MGMFNDIELLGLFDYTTVTNALMEPTAALPVLEATVHPKTSIALYTGPRPLYITYIQVTFSDIVNDDTNADRYLGWAVWSATDGGTGPTYASLKGYTANADLPLIVDDSVSGTAIQAVVNVPVNLFNYVGATRASPDVLYAKQANEPSASSVPPIRVAANAVYQVRLGAYLAGSLVAIT
ncbi:hypothetical protein LCGC14_2827460, partial [marine sediment metagenome]